MAFRVFCFTSAADGWANSKALLLRKVYESGIIIRRMAISIRGYDLEAIICNFIYTSDEYFAKMIQRLSANSGRRGEQFEKFYRSTLQWSRASTIFFFFTRYIDLSLSFEYSDVRRSFYLVFRQKLMS